MTPAPASDLEFVAALRDAVGRYFAAVDEWESAYKRYYRLPDAATPSADLAAEQRKFEARRRELAKFLPRARALCFRYGKPDVFAGLPHVSLGHYTPQERTDSSVGRGERGAVMACLIELSVASRASEAGLPTETEADTCGTRPSLLDRIVGLLR
jgi:hypothetical protein